MKFFLKKLASSIPSDKKTTFYLVVFLLIFNFLYFCAVFFVYNDFVSKLFSLTVDGIYDGSLTLGQINYFWFVTIRDLFILVILFLFVALILSYLLARLIKVIYKFFNREVSVYAVINTALIFSIIGEIFKLLLIFIVYLLGEQLSEIIGNFLFFVWNFLRIFVVVFYFIVLFYISKSLEK